MYIIYALTHDKKNQIKEKIIVESQAYCEGKQETSIHEILSNGLYLWLGTFKVQIVESIIARLHGLVKIKETYTCELDILVLFMEACNV